MHQPVIRQTVHAFRLHAAWFQTKQRLRLRHLIHDDLVFAQWLLRNAMPGLNHRRLRRRGGGSHPRRPREKTPDRHRVRRVVRTLVDHLQHVVRAKNRRRHLNPARAPAIRQRHLTGTKRHLMSWNRNSFQQRTPDHPLALLVEVGEIVTFHAEPSARIRRTVCSSLWKST